jgi:hypothetical protein
MSRECVKCRDVVTYKNLGCDDGRGGILCLPCWDASDPLPMHLAVLGVRKLGLPSAEFLAAPPAQKERK